VNRTRTFLLGAMGLAALAGRAAADGKKPGMFDFESWKSPVAREREAAGQIAPGTFDLTPAVLHPGEPRIIRVRVYADGDYRGLIMRWQARLRGQLARINAVAGPVFNVTFEIESIHAWERSHVGVAFDPIMKELAALDPAREVDLVLGLVTPMRGVATSMHQVGQAFTPGRYLVLRGMDDEQEGLAIDREYHLLSADERARLYGDRKAHREVAVFLHEWGHSAGLLHEEDRAMIMNPALDPRQAAFSEFDKQVLALVIDRRHAHPGEPFPERADLAALYEKVPASVGSEKERMQLLSFLRPRPTTRDRSTPDEEAPSGLSQADVDIFNRAGSAANAKHLDEAWKIFAPLFGRLAASGANASDWTRAARLATAVGALTAAEEAIGHVARGAPEIEKLAVDVEAIRLRIALPPGRKAGVPPEREPDYLALFRTAPTLVASCDLAGARAGLEAFAAAFPDTAGTDLLTCEVEVGSKHAAIAAKHCQAALDKFKFAERAHYLLGLLAARGGRGAQAEQHLQAAIHIDPRDTGAWQTLGQLYRSQRARGRLDELDRRYQAEFAAPLPQ
jgi:tetratricopeptide (TPR) repeat protein